MVLKETVFRKVLSSFRHVNYYTSKNNITSAIFIRNLYAFTEWLKSNLTMQ